MIAARQINCRKAERTGGRDATTVNIALVGTGAIGSGVTSGMLL
jgi:hypothetical protein